MSYIIAIIFVTVIVSVYLVVSYYNKKTPIPESCHTAFTEAQDCTLCAKRNSCGIKLAMDEMKEINK